MIAAFILTFNILLIITFDCAGPEEKDPYVLKRLQPPKNMWIKSMLKAMSTCAESLFKTLTKMQVHRRYQPQGHQSAGPRVCGPKKVPWDLLSQDSIPVMTTTWANGTFKTLPGRQFDSDSRALMLDDGASACIINDKGDFIEPPTN